MTTDIAGGRIRARTRRERTGRRRDRWVPYAFISPFYVLYVLFMIGPIGVAVWLSFCSWVGLGAPHWVGLRNYRLLATDASFHRALANTGYYVLVCMLVVVPAALLVAQALNTRGLRVRDLWRTAYFLPTVVSPI